MRHIYIPSMLALSIAAGNAFAACTPIRIGYPDQHRPPYYLGTGSEVGKPAGASADLLREIAEKQRCPVTLVRLPLARLRGALEAGTIDAMPLEAHEPDTDTFALPVDANGKLDKAKSLRLYTVMFVRAGDPALRYAAPTEFGQRWLGVNHAAPLLATLRGMGFRIDDGALDPTRNIEKLIRHRIDGYAVSVAAQSDMDSWVAARFGSSVVRMPQPLQTHSIWLATSKQYYQRNRPHVEAMWKWVGENAPARFGKLVRKYEKTR